MRRRPDKQTSIVNLDARKRQLESELARISDAEERKRLVQQIHELEAARHMDGWLRSPGLRPPS